MRNFTICLAGLPIAVCVQFPETQKFCADYCVENVSPCFAVSVTAEDLEREKQWAEDESPTLVRLERSALYRKIAEQLPFYDTFLFHGSAIAVDGEGYLFSASSGTGKSTHARFWREYFGERACMINDDKPLIQIKEGKAWVCGTPWDGKHHLSSNQMVPLQGIGLLYRAEQTTVDACKLREAFPLLLQQTYRPENIVAFQRVLELLEKMGQMLPIYHLGCHLSVESAKIASQEMRKGKL